MELLPGIVADGTALYLAHAKTLVLSDLHIGYEEERRKRGVLLPGSQRGLLKRELDRLFKRHPIRRVVLAGDVKHEFGKISREEWRDVQEFVTGLRERGADVVVVGGNHDNMLAPILDRLVVPFAKSLLIGNGTGEKRQDVLIVHGDATLKELVEKGKLGKDDLKKTAVLVMGHEHPAMAITDGVRTETVKCFLLGAHKRKRLIVLPSSNPLAFGTDVLRERPLGPLLDSFGDFSAYGWVDGKALAFGTVASLRRATR